MTIFSRLKLSGKLFCTSNITYSFFLHTPRSIRLRLKFMISKNYNQIIYILWVSMLMSTQESHELSAEVPHAAPVAQIPDSCLCKSRTIPKECDIQPDQWKPQKLFKFYFFNILTYISYLNFELKATAYFSTVCRFSFDYTCNYIMLVRACFFFYLGFIIFTLI